MTNEKVVDGETTENTDEDLASNDTQEENQNQEEQNEDNERNRQLYARVKKAEEKAKVLEAKLIAQDKEQSTDSKADKGPYELAKEMVSLRDFNENELGVIQRYAKAFDMSLSDAAKHSDVLILVKSMREKEKLQNNIPTPTNRQGTAKSDYSAWTSSDLETASTEQILAYREFHRHK